MRGRHLELRQRWTYPATDPQTLKYFADKGVRPIRTLLPSICVEDGDVAGWHVNEAN
jgi:hypothetical protein